MGRKPAKGRDDGSKKWCRQLCMTDAELTTLRALMRERIQQSTVQEIPQHGNHRENKFWCNGTLFPALQNEFPKHFPNPIISDKEKLRVIQEIMVREKVLLKSVATNRANNQTQEGSSAANEAFGTAEVFETIRYGDQIQERTVNEGLVEDEQNTLVDYTSDPTTIDGTESSLKIDTPKSGDKKLCIIETRRVRYHGPWLLCGSWNL